MISIKKKKGSYHVCVESLQFDEIGSLALFIKYWTWFINVSITCSSCKDIDDEIGSVESLQFNVGTIRVATVDFFEANKLGQDGFGAIYKVIL